MIGKKHPVKLEALDSEYRMDSVVSLKNKWSKAIGTSCVSVPAQILIINYSFKCAQPVLIPVWFHNYFWMQFVFSYTHQPVYICIFEQFQNVSK